MYREPAKDLLIDTMLSLMSNHKIEKISVSDILAASNVSRSTFYRNFKDKYDLLNACYKREMEQCFERADAADWKDILIDVCMICDRNFKAFRNGLDSGDINSLENYSMRLGVDLFEGFYRQWKQVDTVDEKTRAVIMAYVEGNCFLMRKWIRKEIDLSIEELAQCYYDCRPVLLSEMFDSIV